MNQLEDSTQKPSDLSIAGELANADTRFRPDLPSVYSVVVHVCSCVCRGVCKGVCMCVHGDWGQPLPILFICYPPCPLRQSLQRPRTHEVSLAGWPASPGNPPSLPPSTEITGTNTACFPNRGQTLILVLTRQGLYPLSDDPRS